MPPDVLAMLDASARHRLKILATMAGLRRAAVVSHASAAVLHGIPLWGYQSARCRSPDVRRHPAIEAHGFGCMFVRLDDGEVCQIDGLSVTTVTRTLLDLGRGTAFESGIVAADFALHEGMTTNSALAASAREMCAESQDASRPGAWSPAPMAQV